MHEKIKDINSNATLKIFYPHFFQDFEFSIKSKVILSFRLVPNDPNNFIGLSSSIKFVNSELSSSIRFVNSDFKSPDGAVKPISAQS